MEKNKSQLVSEVWDSMAFTMPNTGYAERAMTNGVAEANNGYFPELSFGNIIKNLKPYFLFDIIDKGNCFNDSYARGKGISSNIIVEVTHEVDSDLTKRLNAEEESRLKDIIDGNLTYQEMEETIEISGIKIPKVLADLGGASIPLISAKLTYSINERKEPLEKVRKTLLYSGLEKV